MKHLLLSFLVLFFTQICLAQVPGLINYQAVARNASGQALANQSIKVRISLYSSDASGVITFYNETRQVTTNALGLFNVQIGAAGALATTGNINNTNWADGTKTRNIKVDLDVNNSGTFTEMGTQQLVSVPYALAAQTAVTAQKLSTPYIGFRADLTTVATVNVGSYLIKFDYKQHDSTNAYNTSTGEFTVPEDGMYLLYTTVTVTGPSNPGLVETANITFFSNTRGPLHYLAANAVQKLVPNYNSISTMVMQHLTKGEKISIRLDRLNATANWSITHEGTFFGAYKVR